jgi:hypothetical protein
MALSLGADVLRARAKAELGLNDSLADDLLDHWRTQRFPARRDSLAGPDAAFSDLQRWVMGGGQKTAQPAVNWVVVHAPQLLAVSAVLASALFGLYYSDFYESLGVSPEEVGIGSTEILTRSVMGGVALAFLFAFVLLLALLPTIAVLTPELDDKTAIQRRRPAPLEWVGFLGLMAFAGLVINDASESEYYQAFLEDPSEVPIIFLGAPLVIALWRTFKRSGPLLRLRLRFLGFVGLMLLPVGVIAIPTVLPVLADDRAEDVRLGQAVEPLEVADLPVLGVRAQPARLLLTDRQPGDLAQDRCLLYLGQGDGQLVAYVPSRETTLRVPTNVAATTPNSSASRHHCSKTSVSARMRSAESSYTTEKAGSSRWLRARTAPASSASSSRSALSGPGVPGRR